MQSAKIGKFTVWYDNAEELNELRREIWTNHVYYMEEIERPKRIIDMGAHIGLASLYFAQIYPEAKIIAYEPEPKNYALLEMNVQENQLRNVETINAAVAPKSGVIKLNTPIEELAWRSGAGIIERGWRKVQTTYPFEAKAVGIDWVLREGADMVKMDVEGMEYELVEAADWSKVSTMIVEMHPRSGKRIAEVEKVLQTYKFDLEIQKDPSRWGQGLVKIYARKEGVKELVT